MNNEEHKLFIEFLHKISDNKAILSKLRSNDPINSYISLVEVLPSNKMIQDIYIIITKLYAINPKWSKDVNFGMTCKKIGQSVGFERRFRYLLLSDRQEVYHRIEHIIRFLKANEIGINWSKLLIDLIYWGDNTKRQWIFSYYGRKRDNKEGSENE